MLVKPICHPCQRFYRPEKNGFKFLEGMPMSPFTLPGKEFADEWKPYKLWVGDLWKCQGCGHQLIVGVIAGPISEHYHPSFQSYVDHYGVTYQVNDC